MHPVVSSESGLTQSTGVRVLGTVSIAFPERRRQEVRRDVLRLSVATGCLIVAFLVTVVMSQQGYRLSITALKRMVGS